MRAYSVILLLLLGGCASGGLLPIEVSGRADLWVSAHPTSPSDSTVPSGISHQASLIKLSEWATKSGYSITYTELASTGYVGRMLNKHAELDLQLTPDGALNTLLHELAHDLILFDGTHNDREVVAETVAYMVAANLSWHTSESLGYIATVPVGERNWILQLHEKEILRVVNLLTNACK